VPFHRTLAVRAGFATALAFASFPSAAAAATVAFQNGVGGYTSMLDVVIGIDNNAQFQQGAVGVVGSTINEIFVDGRYREQIATIVDEKQYLVRFSNIFGNGPGQIPLGARIVDANFYITSGETSGNAQSNGPFGVAQLLVPFDETTSWNSLSAAGTGTGGATFGGGQIARPMDRGFRGLLPRTNADNGVVINAANVTQAVQNWSNGQANHGLAVVAGTDDGWQIITSGVFLPNVRPKLEVVYDAAPQTPSTTVALQQGVNGYAGTTMVQLNEDDTTVDGSTLDEAFLDGETPIFGNGGDNHALIKFANIFTNQGGEVPIGATILDAQLVFDTGRAAFSVDSGTNGSFSAHQMLKDWSTASKYSDFGVDIAGSPDGPTAEDGDIGPVLDITGAMIADARTFLDVTQAVRNWQSGQPNYGIDVRALNTDDGWAINFTGSFDSPPQLQITYAAPGVSFLNADTDIDGDVDGADFLNIQRNIGKAGDVTFLDGDANDDGSVTAADLAVWRQQFGAGSAAAGNPVPEPTAVWLACAGLIALAAKRRR
jgi:hypothetical protein